MTTRLLAVAAIAAAPLLPSCAPTAPPVAQTVAGDAFTAGWVLKNHRITIDAQSNNKNWKTAPSSYSIRHWGVEKPYKIASAISREGVCEDCEGVRASVSFVSSKSADTFIISEDVTKPLTPPIKNHILVYFDGKIYKHSYLNLPYSKYQIYDTPAGTVAASVNYQHGPSEIKSMTDWEVTYVTPKGKTLTKRLEDIPRQGRPNTP